MQETIKTECSSMQGARTHVQGEAREVDDAPLLVLHRHRAWVLVRAPYHCLAQLLSSHRMHTISKTVSICYTLDPWAARR